jgi:glycosyltransferase involved in cell wall biosynthesis
MSNQKYVRLSTGPDGIRRVKAVMQFNSQAARLMERDKNIVKLPAGQSEGRLLDCLYIDGEFVHKAALAKRARNAAAKGRRVDKIVWSYHDFGYGNSLAHVGRETVRWLKRKGVPVYIRPWSNQPHPTLDIPFADDEALKSAAVIVMDRYPIPDHVFETLKNVPFLGGYYMLEGSRVREMDMNRLEGYDTIFTPSAFCQKAMLESGVRAPIFVWGHGFDHEVFPYVEPKPDRPFTFLWFGDENRRKGYDLFLQAFSQVRIPNVRAWIRGPGSGNVSHMRRNYEQDHRIVWDTAVTPPEQLKEMMAEVDVLVSPLRGEGFGLTLLEAMAAGRPVIATRWSGPIDFGGGDDMTYWVDVASREPAQNDSGVQVVPSMDGLVRKMIACAQNPAEVRARGRKVSAHVHQNWRWEKKVCEAVPYLRKMIPDFLL